MATISAQIHFMMTAGYFQGLGQFSGSGAKPSHLRQSAPPTHRLDPAAGLERTNQNKTVRFAILDQNVQHPMHAVVKINVGCSRVIALDECSRARAIEGMRGLIVFGKIRFGFNDHTGATAPHESSSNQPGGTNQRIASEKISPNQLLGYRRVAKLLGRRVINRQRHFARNRFTVPECGNELRPV